jgi:hypothetical protein
VQKSELWSNDADALALSSDIVRVCTIDLPVARLDLTLVLSSIGEAVGSDYVPYQPIVEAQFLDDMRASSDEELGLIILVKNASLLFDQKQAVAFRLIEIFLEQQRFWSERNKPCHLIFELKSQGQFSCN